MTRTWVGEERCRVRGWGRRLRALGVLGAIALAPPLARCEEAQGIAIDKTRGEVRIPCKFVNPSRLLEVFACHKTGPTHETVLEFDVTGPVLTQALLDLGCRGAAYWNGTSPDDFERNQGDRILAIVRWEHAGEKFELPADGILTDGETEFPAFVRGFSFGSLGAFKVDPRKDDPASEAIEISLGAALRQAQPHSVLSHPTSFRALQPWMLPPYLDTRVVVRHRELVEEAVPVTLILRRVAREEEIIETARRSSKDRGLRDADALYDQALPIARQIDALKSDYEGLLRELRSTIDAGASAPASDRNGIADRVQGILMRGRWLCSRIQERYLSLYGLEEAYKAAWVEKRTDLPEEVRDQAIVLARDGFRFEPLLAAKRVALDELALPTFEGKDGDRNLGQHILKAETEAIELERGLALTLANVHYVETRMKDAQNDAYLRRLFEEDRMRQGAIAGQYKAKLKLAGTEIEELRGLLDGSWDAKKDSVHKARAAAQRELEAAKLEEDLAVLAEEIRYAESDALSEAAERKANAEKKLEELKAKKLLLEKKVADLKSQHPQ